MSYVSRRAFRKQAYRFIHGRQPATRWWSVMILCWREDRINIIKCCDQIMMKMDTVCFSFSTPRGYSVRGVVEVQSGCATRRVLCGKSLNVKRILKKPQARKYSKHS